MAVFEEKKVVVCSRGHLFFTVNKTSVSAIICPECGEKIIDALPTQPRKTILAPAAEKHEVQSAEAPAIQDKLDQEMDLAPKITTPVISNQKSMERGNTSNTFKNNAYCILGLETSANQKDILKRSREIINHLKIGEHPEYDLDVNLFKDFRTEESVKEAVQRLQTPKKKIKEYFFWFQIADSIDQQALGLLRSKDYLGSSVTWQNASDTNNARFYSYKRNLAILYCLLLSIGNNEHYLQDSLLIWKELLGSEDFWTFFSKEYKLQDEQTTSQEIITDFENQAVGYLADIYTELHQIHNNAEYINEFQKIFSTKGEKIERNVLEPAYQAINDATKKLEEMKVGEDGVLTKQETEEIKNLYGSIQLELNKLIDLGFYDDSQTKIMRDKVANALKTIVLDLHNNLSETEKALSLLNIALKIVGTSSLEATIKHEIQTLEKIKKNTDLINPVSDLIAQEKYEEALQRLYFDQAKYQEDPELQKLYDRQKKFFVSNIASRNNSLAWGHLELSRMDLAKLLSRQAGDLIYDNIILYNFNRKAIDEMLAEIHSNLTRFKSCHIKRCYEYRNSFAKLANEQFKGQPEEMALVILVDSYLFPHLINLHKRKKEADTMYNIGSYTWWFGVGLIFYIAGWIHENRG
ncbi:MAG: hypothetical protein V2A65_08000 [Candidatus Omnitrophota bacterium]